MHDYQTFSLILRTSKLVITEVESATDGKNRIFITCKILKANILYDWSLEYKLVALGFSLFFQYCYIIGLHKAGPKQVLNQQCNLTIESDIDR